MSIETEKIKSEISDALTKPVKELEDIEAPCHPDFRVQAVYEQILNSLSANIVAARQAGRSELVVFSAESSVFDKNKPSEVETAVIDVLQKKLPELLEGTGSLVGKRNRGATLNGQTTVQIIISLDSGS